MSVHSYLQRYPNARPSTIAHLLKKEQVTEQLRRELGMPKRKSFWQRIAFWRR
jgi:hypothetical protein